MKNNWEETESYRHRPAKINKHRFCKKNKKSGKEYGPHLYDVGSVYCKLCGHIDKSKTNPNYIEDMGD